MDLSKHLEKADEAVRRKNYNLAIGLYHRILDLDPDYGEAREGLRTALDRKLPGPRGGGALGWVQGFLPLLSSKISRLARNYRGQARNLERFLAQVPGNVAGNLALGEALERAGCPHSALVVYRHLGGRISEEGKGSPRAGEGARAWRLAGLLARKLERFDEAFECFEAGLLLNPRDQESLRARKNLAAEGALRKGGYARASSSRELLRDLETHKALEREQRIHRSEEEIQKDLAGLEERLRASPEDPVLLRKVGEMRARAGRIEEALECLEEALEREPGDFGLLVMVGDLTIQDLEKQRERARKLEADEEVRILDERIESLRLGELRKRVGAHPTDLGLRHDLGRQLLKGGDLDGAIAEFQKSLRDPRHKLEALILLGQAFRGKGMKDLARSQFEKALETAGAGNPKYMDLRYELGLLAQEEGKNEEAREHFSKILELDISYKDVAQRLETLEA